MSLGYRPRDWDSGKGSAGRGKCSRGPGGLTQSRQAGRPPLAKAAKDLYVKEAMAELAEELSTTADHLSVCNR
jgi:hypothetical protein